MPGLCLNVSGTYLELSKTWLDVSRMCLDISKTYQEYVWICLEVSRTYMEVSSSTCLNMSRHV